MGKSIIRMTAAALFTLAALVGAAPQGCPQNAHLITELPYFNPQQTLPCMYAGTLKSSDALADGSFHNIFYWLFRDPTREPSSMYTVWLNGGPGATSMFGLFAENGPLRISRNGTGADDYLVSFNQAQSWFGIGDILFIDQPVGTGFSFTSNVNQTFVSDMSQAGDEFLAFMKNFVAMHPDYDMSKRNMTLTGESYAGKYLPYFTSRLIDDGSIANVVNVLLGNPYTSPVNQRTSTHKVAQSLNIIDSYNMD